MSVNPLANLGSVPCVLSLSVMVFALRLAGAPGVAFRLNVILESTSVCAVISGVPFAVNDTLKFAVPSPA